MAEPKAKVEKRPFKVRLFNKKVLNLTVRKPTQQESDLSDEEYTAIFNKSLMQGSPTRLKMHHELKKKNLISVDDENRMTQIRNDVNEIDTQVKKLSKRLGDKKEAEFNEHDRAVANELKDLQRKRTPLMQEFNELRNVNDSMFSRTADQQAENAQRNYLLACTIEYGTGNEGHDEGEHLWDSVDAIMRETEYEKYQRSLYEYMMVVQDLPSDGDEVFGLNDPEPKDEDEQETQVSTESQAEDARQAAETSPDKKADAKVEVGEAIMTMK